jgi:HD-GYP domain-containing protein (c-di-GMP phosphodiesterase class II)
VGRAAAEAVGAILAREEELDATARELMVAYGELALTYELGHLLAQGGQEGEVAQAVLESLNGALPSDASALFTAEGDATFMRLVAARADDEAALSALTAAAHWAVRQGVAAQAVEGAVVAGCDTDAAGLQGEALFATAHCQDDMTDMIVLLRHDAASAFDSGEVKLACSTAQGTAMALCGARLRERLSDLFMSTIRALAAAVDAKDPYTRGHSQRVAALAVAAGRRMGIEGARLEQLQLAALLHDVGKIAVNSDVLAKPSSLDDREWSMVKAHPAEGAEILVCVPQLAPIVQVVRWHHERYGGGGYPDGLKGEEIPLPARLVCVCDAYDAMTSARPYRGPMTQPVALEELRRETGDKFDPACVEALAAVVAPEVPAGLESSEALRQAA